MNFFEKITSSLSRSSDKITEGLNNIFIKKKLDEKALEELEELLISTDMGVTLSTKIIAELAKKKFDKEIEIDEVKKFLSNRISTLLKKHEKTFKIPANNNRPYIIQFVGVNGSGKTTTIGKIAKKFKSQGKKVMIVACDTFRAAAVEQLETWAKRAEVDLFKGKEKQDPASVAYQAYEKAAREGFEIVIVDTAGRLQNKVGLMEELAKITRVLKKHDESLPDKTILIIDGVTGQNGLQQAKLFKEFTDISGIIITKLDGTAKGGIAVSIAENFNLPIYAVGVGEKDDDLKEFNAKNFVDSLLGL